jgi:predicted GIY-YIG superfamily endonuclease
LFPRAGGQEQADFGRFFCHACAMTDPAQTCCRASASAEHYHVYVVELAGEDGGPVTVYVGQSVRSPAERFAQHRAGFKAARAVKRSGLWLRWRLFEHWNPLLTRAEALTAEKRLADHLRSKGYTVKGGH